MKFTVSNEIVPTLPYVRGRPSEYHPKMCDVVIATAKAGGFEAAMCVNCGISTNTFKKYQMEHPEFKEAVEYAELIILQLQEDLLNAGAQGTIENYNFKANQFILQNKYKKLYDTKIGNNTEININTINMTPEQMQQKIAQKLEKLKSMGIETNISEPVIINQGQIDE